LRKAVGNPAGNGKADSRVAAADPDDLGAAIGARDILPREVGGHWGQNELEAVEDRRVAITNNRAGVIDAERLGECGVERIDDIDDVKGNRRCRSAGPSGRRCGN